MFLLMFPLKHEGEYVVVSELLKILKWSQYLRNEQCAFSPSSTSFVYGCISSAWSWRLRRVFVFTLYLKGDKQALVYILWPTNFWYQSRSTFPFIFLYCFTLQQTSASNSWSTQVFLCVTTLFCLSRQPHTLRIYKFIYTWQNLFPVLLFPPLICIRKLVAGMFFRQNPLCKFIGLKVLVQQLSTDLCLQSLQQ